VTVNLESALRHLRELYKEGEDSLVLWVDALCINQEDVGERTSQVQFMGAIYTQCQQVIVYLGDNIEGTSQMKRRLTNENYKVAGTLSNQPQTRRREYGVPYVFKLFQELGQNKHLLDIVALHDSVYTPDERDLFGNSIDRTRLIETLRRIMCQPGTSVHTVHGELHLT
jgi:hypothetical protein